MCTRVMRARVATAFLLVPTVMNAQVAQASNASSEGTNAFLGTLPAWVSAILTGAALLQAVRLFRRESEDRIRRQADQVYGWKDSSPGPPAMSQVYVTVRNLSEQPIWNIDVGLVESGQRFRRAAEKVGDKDLEPNGCSRWEWKIKEAQERRLDRQVAVDFTDASGRRWRRTGSSLERVRPRRRISLPGSR